MRAHPEKLFIFRLARELGMTVKRLLTEADSREIGEWVAFFKIESDPDKQSGESLKSKFQAQFVK